MMNTRFNQQKERLEKIREEGPAKFILKYGLAFALLLGFFILFISRPPVPSYLLAGLIIVAGFFFGIGMWFFMMWQYRNYH